MVNITKSVGLFPISFPSTLELDSFQSLQCDPIVSFHWVPLTHSLSRPIGKHPLASGLNSVPIEVIITGLQWSLCCVVEYFIKSQCLVVSGQRAEGVKRIECDPLLCACERERDQSQDVVSCPLIRSFDPVPKEDDRRWPCVALPGTLNGNESAKVSVKGPRHGCWWRHCLEDIFAFFRFIVHSQYVH